MKHNMLWLFGLLVAMAMPLQLTLEAKPAQQVKRAAGPKRALPAAHANRKTVKAPPSRAQTSRPHRVLPVHKIQGEKYRQAALAKQRAAMRKQMRAQLKSGKGFAKQAKKIAYKRPPVKRTGKQPLPKVHRKNDKKAKSIEQELLLMHKAPKVHFIKDPEFGAAHRRSLAMAKAQGAKLRAAQANGAKPVAVKPGSAKPVVSLPPAKLNRSAAKPVVAAKVVPAHQPMIADK